MIRWVIAVMMLCSSVLAETVVISTTGSNQAHIPDAHVVTQTQYSNLRVATVRQLDSECDDGLREAVLIDGRILYDNKWISDVKSRIVAAKPCYQNGSVRVFLSSTGGSAQNGMVLGQLLRARQATAYVPPGGICFSACADAFLGGASRLMASDAVLMYHPSFQMSNGQLVCDKKHSEAYNIITKYYRRMLSQVPAAMLITDGWNCNKDTVYDKPQAQERSLLTESAQSKS
jgi:ATP-dependent protease ClpP protease subunit